jgi:hypothetical protein|tara:strand:- start:261 stop:452 length:192 start_codon:yes stop_codon:yes gene_type:complete
MKYATYLALVSQTTAIKFFKSTDYEVNDGGVLAAQIAQGDKEYLDKAMTQEISADTPINIHLL